MSWIKPLKLGSVTLKNNIAFSPLAGCSDLPFRRLVNLFRPSLYFCEMVKIDALIRHDKGTYRILSYTPDMHPIGAQICGSNPKLAKEAAKIVEDLGFDVVDLNCGCPVDKVTKDNSGSGLLKSPQLIGEILNEMVNAVKIPVTVKIRVGWDDQAIVAPQVTKIAEEAGAKAIFVHGRTRQQAYKGVANRQLIKDCVDVKKEILVFGNGDIFDTESALDMFETTKCDGILVSRGTLGAPWISELIESNLGGKPFSHEINGDFLRNFLKMHLEYSKSFNDDKRTMIDMRKVATWTFRNEPRMAQFREKLNKAKSLVEVEEIIECCPL